jgi:inner membrane protein
LSAILLTVLVLQVPLLMMNALVGERQARRDAAVADVSAKWGTSQSIVGPALLIPYVHRWTENVSGRGEIARAEQRGALFLPARLRIRATIDAETRSRGIFAIPVYRVKATFDGEFAELHAADLNLNPADLAWDRAQLIVNISDVRAIQEHPVVAWDGSNIPFTAGSGWTTGGGSGIHADVPIDPSARPTFSFPLSVNGSVAAYFAPFGLNTVVEVSSNFPSPTFQGAWLPSDRAVTANGFTATWSVASIARSYPQAWTTASAMKDPIANSLFGVELLQPVDHYRMASRSVKYAALFLVLTFAAVWLIEVLSAQRVHPIQYLLLGAAVCMFYLLELSLSEHLGFGFAYAVAALAVIGVMASYCGSILKAWWRAAVVSGSVAALYGYLYIVLTNEDYALLIGTIGLFVALAVVMLTTRRIDWYAEVPLVAASDRR